MLIQELGGIVRNYTKEDPDLILKNSFFLIMLLAAGTAYLIMLFQLIISTPSKIAWTITGLVQDMDTIKGLWPNRLFCVCLYPLD